MKPIVDILTIENLIQPHQNQEKNMIHKSSGSLIQLHYHNRIGGVTQVIKRYAIAFNESVVAGQIFNTVFCHDMVSQNVMAGVGQIYSMKECDYHCFRSKEHFNNCKEKILTKLESIINDKNIPKPICIIGHNLSLGKNIALSAAFVELADKYNNDSDLSFFSVIHDLVEEGRIGLLEQLNKMEMSGIPVWENLYPYKKNIQYILLNIRNNDLFKKAGFSSALLFNPLNKKNVPKKLSDETYKKIEKACISLAKHDNTSFNSNSKTFFYPVRIIKRKNVIEAIILTCLINKANLIIGGRGTSDEDNDFYDTLVRFVQKYKLNVLFDVERVDQYLPDYMGMKGSTFDWIYAYSDLCISTSIAEGFGYALYEPWFYSRAVIGRLPLGVSQTELLDLSHLYDIFDVPIEWIPLDLLVRKYFNIMNRIYFSVMEKVTFDEFKTNFYNYFISRGKIDFGILSDSLQLSILKKLCVGRLPISFISNKLEGDGIMHVQNWKNIPVVSHEIIRKNRKIIMDEITGDSFSKRFRECFLQNIKFTNTSDRQFHNFLDEFASLRKFRLLMASSS